MNPARQRYARWAGLGVILSGAYLIGGWELVAIGCLAYLLGYFITPNPNRPKR